MSPYNTLSLSCLVLFGHEFIRSEGQNLYTGRPELFIGFDGARDIVMLGYRYVLLSRGHAMRGEKSSVRGISVCGDLHHEKARGGAAPPETSTLSRAREAARQQGLCGCCDRRVERMDLRISFVSLLSLFSARRSANFLYLCHPRRKSRSEECRS